MKSILARIYHQRSPRSSQQGFDKKQLTQDQDQQKRHKGQTTLTGCPTTLEQKRFQDFLSSMDLILKLTQGHSIILCLKGEVVVFQVIEILCNQLIKYQFNKILPHLIKQEEKKASFRPQFRSLDPNLDHNFFGGFSFIRCQTLS